MKHKGLIVAVFMGCLMTLALLYMFGVISGDAKTDVVYFVSKTSSENSTFWHSVERGVKVAADELGLEVVFVGPEREIDLEDQVALVRRGIALEPLAIVLAASDYNILAPPAREVLQADITFVTVDSDVNIDEDHSFIATDNVDAARQLAEAMAGIIHEQGLVAMISHLEGTTSSIDRMEGFRQGLKPYRGIQLLEEVPYSNNDADLAYEKTKKLLEENPGIKGLFGTNEATLIGIARAVDDLDLVGEVAVVGFDISDAAASYIEKDVIQTIVIQRPFNMGYLSVKEAYLQAKHGKGNEFIHVDVVMVTKDNMFDEQIQKFLIPFLE